jgi:hypothetical protein
MAATLALFLQARAAYTPPRAAMMNAMNALAAVKQKEVVILDDARDTQLNEPSAGRAQALEEEIQVVGGVVRHLEAVTHDLAALVAAIDRQTAVEASLANVPA